MMLKHTLANIVAALAVITLMVGCATPRQTVANAHRTYQTTSAAFKAAVEADLIRNPKVLEAAAVADEEAYNALQEATALIKSDKQIDAKYIADRAESAVLRFVELWAKIERLPDAR